MNGRIDSKTIMDAAQRAASWLTSQQAPDGRYGEEDDLNAYYKSPYPLRIAGQPAAASRCLGYVIRRYMTPDGDFFNSPAERTAGTYTRYYCQIYPNFWLLRAACVLNRFDLAQRVFAFLLTCQDEATGGAYYEVDRASGLLDSNSTACLCLAGLMCGDIRVAARAGDALLHWKGLQNADDRFYLRWRPGGDIQTAFDDDKALYYVVDATQNGQFYWQAGLPLAALAKLYLVTREGKYLSGSVGLYDYLLSCQPDVVASLPVGKLGWGSAILYGITGDRRYLDTNRRITAYYLDTQHRDGYWLSPVHETIETQPLNLTTDLTGEFCAWLLDYTAELENGSPAI